MAKKSVSEFTKFLALMAALTIPQPAFTATPADVTPITIVESVQRTNMERNAEKRMAAGKRMTPFTKSANLETKSASIDFALTEFHSLHELAKILGYPENYIQRHINHLKTNFHTTCKEVSEGKKIKFIHI